MESEMSLAEILAPGIHLSDGREKKLDKL